MKKIISFFVCLSLYAIAGESIELRVVGVASNDILNVRKEASYKSEVVAKLEPFSTGFYTIKTLPQNPSIWLPISIKNSHKIINGWVKRRYVTQNAVTTLVQTSKILLKYPLFMEATKGKDGSINVSYDIRVNHYDGCDMRDNPAVATYFTFFSFSFALYDTLKDALKSKFESYYNNGNFENELQYDMQKDWFKRVKKDGWVEELNFYGKSARRIMIGAEGCGLNYYFYRESGKVVMVTEGYNTNPPIDPKSNTLLSGNWELPDKNVIVANIVKSLRVKGK